MIDKLYESEGIIVMIEAVKIGIGGGEKQIETLRITMDNHGNDFVIDYETGKVLKVGDKLKTKIERWQELI